MTWGLVGARVAWQNWRPKPVTHAAGQTDIRPVSASPLYYSNEVYPLLPCVVPCIPDRPPSSTTTTTAAIVIAT